MISPRNIRNFCIISHIDHGKSTLADRFLELTNTVPKGKMRAQFLDQMELEREKGITIKLQPVTMNYATKDESGLQTLYFLNLIDTPGHVDFSYEVSRSLAAVEGALLLVDATQGIEAQTLTNLHLALEQNLVIIPIINKIDLPNALIEKTSKEIKQLLNSRASLPLESLVISAKTGQNVEKVLEAIIKKIPSPKGDPGAPLRALIFDSDFDEYKGVIAYIRIIDGKIKKGDKIRFMVSEKEAEALEVGIFKPHLVSTDCLGSGQIGYVATGLKEIEKCQVGDTVTRVQEFNIKPLPGYKKTKPMVFAGLFCQKGDDYSKLREALGKLKLTDASLIYEPERSSALGFGFRCGFLGLLHLEIVKERLKREYNLDLIVTTPSVAYQVKLR